ncbi:hypothetical protein EHQ12_10285 [Leptospira gomenensis]|uniref:Uncharacterized protein n=1 Tax=Leptospira gomenensis TaxID=2484974 RepID=A0A5F1YZJ5_9LEPT|nr:hypothetical protein [Leptospira gomenensis]TGK36412.1 hypothetical protein EHQ17_03850 [Leptospira gomenensis]TGK38241.1 hypothetical protein EHQ12_10285 [Leptospira gomenensis]TGK45982.1 hypothetical protein EHQ07_07410 [Leptospira gomenensis]TGK65246.1 hypothetical protein EHQ13_05215 [Leptospira gomenensis]
MDLKESFISQFAAGFIRPRFEIWFSVVLIPENRQAFWVRYTTLDPNPSRGLIASGALWASLFDVKNPKNHRVAAQAFPRDQINTTEDEVFFPGASVGPHHMRGKISVSPKETLSWDLNFNHVLEPARHLPSWLERTPIPKTRSVVSSPFTDVSGTIQLNKNEFPFQSGKGHFNHIWGTNRVAELFWTFVPRFDDDPEGWSLEIVTVRPQSFAPTLTFVTLLKQGMPIHQHSILRSLRSITKVEYPKLYFRTRLDDFEISAEAELDPEQIASYIYRDPDGSPRYIEQSDIGKVTCVLRKKGFERRLQTENGGAVEFHGMKPWRKELTYLDPYSNR